MLLPLGIKLIPEHESNIDSDQEEEPENEECLIERQISEEKPQIIEAKDMTPLAQSDLEHGQDVIDSKSEHGKIPVDHENI